MQKLKKEKFNCAVYAHTLCVQYKDALCKMLMLFPTGAAAAQVALE